MKKLLFNIFILLLASLFYIKSINAQIIINSGVGGAASAATVTTDSTLTGTGASASPLSVNQTSASPLTNLYVGSSSPNPNEAIYLSSGFIDGGGDANNAGSEQRLHFYMSRDGLNWNTLTPLAVYADPQQALYPNYDSGTSYGFVRDPSIAYSVTTGLWYVVYTNCCGASNQQGPVQFGIASSPDLLNWTHLTDYVVTGITSAYQLFAPEWVHNADGSLYVDGSSQPHVTFSVSTSGSLNNFQLYEAHLVSTSDYPNRGTTITSCTESGSTATCTGTGFTFTTGGSCPGTGASTTSCVNITGSSLAGYDGQWVVTAASSTSISFTDSATGLGTGTGGVVGANWGTAPAALTGTNLGANLIDSYIAVNNGTFYLLFNAAGSSLTDYEYSSTSLLSGYTEVGAIGGGVLCEGPQMIQIAASDWRFYCYYNENSEHGLVYQEATSPTGFTTGAFTTMPHLPYVWNQGTIVRVSDIQGMRTILAAHDANAEIWAVNVKQTNYTTVANLTGTNLTWNTVTFDDTANLPYGEGYTAIFNNNDTYLCAPTTGIYEITEGMDVSTVSGSSTGELRFNVVYWPDTSSGPGQGAGLVLPGSSRPAATANPPAYLSADYTTLLNWGDCISANAYQGTGSSQTFEHLFWTMTLEGGY